MLPSPPFAIQNMICVYQVTVPWYGDKNASDGDLVFFFRQKTFLLVEQVDKNVVTN